MGATRIFPVRPLEGSGRYLTNGQVKTLGRSVAR